MRAAILQQNTHINLSLPLNAGQLNDGSSTSQSVSSFHYWIMDILSYLQAMVRSMQLECYNYQKKISLFFNKLHLILIYLFVLKMKKSVTKYVVCYSNI